MEIKKTYLLPGLILLAMLPVSCEDVIDVDFNNAEPALVIEGDVTDFSFTQVVKISRSVPFTDANTFPPISGATVTIADSDGKTYTLHETAQFKGTYVTNQLLGRPLKTYHLKVVSDGKEYTASSVLPRLVKLDSVGIATSVFFNEKQYSVQAYYDDPAGKANFYRFVLSVNNVPSRDIYAFDDLFNDGKLVSAELNIGPDLKSGDKVTVEMQCIDQNVHHYFEGLDQNESRGGASTTPANPVSNISNGALGYFSAHTIQSQSISVK